MPACLGTRNPKHIGVIRTNPLRFLSKFAGARGCKPFR
jgi:hypothetical protein